MYFTSFPHTLTPYSQILLSLPPSTPPLSTHPLCSVTGTYSLDIWAHLSIFRGSSLESQPGYVASRGPSSCTSARGTLLCLDSPPHGLLPPTTPRTPAPHHFPSKADFHKGIHQVLLVAVKAKDLLDVVHHSIVHWRRDTSVTACPCLLYT